MLGGNITGNKATGDVGGGGVCVNGDKGSFIMRGGSIAGNEAKNTGGGS